MMFAGGGWGGSLELPAAGRRPVPLIGDGSDGHPSGSAGRGWSAAATGGSDLISAVASGGGTAVADAWVSGDALVSGDTWVSGDAWVSGAAGVDEAGVGGWSVATTGAARLASWLASAARTVASMEVLSRGAAAELIACGGAGVKAAGIRKEKKERCPVT